MQIVAALQLQGLLTTELVPTKPPCTEECGDMRCPHALDQEISGMLPAAVVASVSSAPGLVPLLIASSDMRLTWRPQVKARSLSR